MKEVSESLAGRVAYYELGPLAVDEKVSVLPLAGIPDVAAGPAA